MKTLTVHVGRDQLSKVMADATNGAIVILTDGERQFTLETAMPDADQAGLDPEEDSVALETELLKAADGPFTPYSVRDLESISGVTQRGKNP